MADSTREDELEIRALIERYADAVNRRDDADWRALDDRRRVGGVRHGHHSA